MFNFLLVVNLTRSQLRLSVNDEDGSKLHFRISPFGKRTDIPERFKQQIVENYSSLNVVVQEQPINYVGELDSAPDRVSQGYAGDFGYHNGKPYYCLEDKVWISDPPYPNQDTRPDQSEIDAVVNPEEPTGGSGSGLTSVTVKETVTNAPVTGVQDDSNKTFTIGESVVSGSVVGYINGIPYPVTEDSSTEFTFNTSFAPDSNDTVTATYKKEVTYE